MGASGTKYRFLIRLERFGQFHYSSARNSRSRMTHAPEFPTFTLKGRLFAGSVGLGLLGLLIVASRLEPDPRGFGTHEQLGLAPCSFYRWTGWLCPTCGATTAWACLLNGDWAAALRANLAGTLLCGLAIAAVPWLLLSGCLGRWWIVRPTLRGVLAVATVMVVVSVLDCLGRAWL